VKSLLRIPILFGVVAASASTLAGQGSGPDWPQFRGPNRDGVLTSFSEPAAWPERLTRRWRVDVGEGYATPVLIGNRIFMFTRQGENEVMRALDAASGKVLWQTSYAAPVTVAPAAKAHGPGPKSTPTFANGRLFTLGMGGIVTAFDTASGKQLWQKPAGGMLPLYGTAMSPLVDRGLVIVHVGGHNQGALTAFDALTGEAKWSWKGDGPSYASPIIGEINGERQVITLTQEHIVGVAAATGQLLWQRPYSTQYTQNIITPILLGQTLLVSGFQNSISAFRIVKTNDRWSADDLWENRDASLYMADGVVVGNALFGMSQRNSGQYFLIDVKTGKTLWTGPPRQAGNAAIVRGGNLAFALEDDAELVISRIGPASPQEIKRYTVADSATWAQPTISGNRIFVKDVTTLTLWTLN
jgi:outer membrane protein assembly factor BamB